MNTNTEKSKGLVVAAVAFDGQTEAVIRAAVSLATRFSMDIRVVNVVESLLTQSWVLAASPYYAAYPIGIAIDDELQEVNQDKMRALLKTIKAPRDLTGTVILGIANASLIAECTARRANVIVTGYNPGTYKLTSGGLSTALGLMHDAPLPVLAVTADATPDFGKSGFKIFVADDLLDTTKEAVRKSYEMAAGLQNSQLRHVHVHPDLKEFLREKWQNLKNRLSSDGQASLQSDDVWVKDYEARVAKLKEQAGLLHDVATKAGVHVTLDVRGGRHVADELFKAVTDGEPDLLVFGRHRLIHSRPSLIGKMPLRTMLAARAAVLVVPPADELFARQPFPAAD